MALNPRNYIPTMQLWTNVSYNKYVCIVCKITADAMHPKACFYLLRKVAIGLHYMHTMA